MARPATAAVRLLTGEREPVRLATTTNIALYGLQAIDGVAAEVGDRVLVKNQADASQNGIYTASEGQWFRAADARTARTMQKGTTVHVAEGTANGGKTFVFNMLDPVIGDTAISIGFYQSDDMISDVNDAVAAGVSSIGAAADSGVAEVQAAGAPIVAAAEAARDAAIAAAATVPSTYPATFSAFKAVDTTAHVTAYFDGSNWDWTLGDFSAQIAADTVGGLYVKANAVAATVGAWRRAAPVGLLQLDWFGSIHDGAGSGNNAANDAALAAAKALLDVEDTAGRHWGLVIPPGKLDYSVMPNFAANDRQIFGLGECRLKNNGTAESMFLDAGAAAGSVRNMRVTGLIMESNTGATDGFRIRGVHISEFEINVRGAGTGATAFKINFGVCNTFKFRCSVNDGPFVGAKPAVGISVTSRDGTTGTDYASYNLFTKPVIEGVTDGISINCAQGNQFVGGTSEANSGTGLIFSANAKWNKIKDVDFEVNTTRDILLNGTENIIEDCDTLLQIFVASGDGNRIRGGSHKGIVIDTPCNDTILENPVFNRLGGGSLSEAGIRTRGKAFNFGTKAWVEFDTFASALKPTTSDGAALGSTALQWSDLFLAGGGVINWATGNYTVTHSTGKLTFSGGIKTGAGTTTVATHQFTPGAFLSAGADGAWEYDGVGLYFYMQAAGRQVITARQIATVQGSTVALSNSSTAAQNIFAAANDTLTVRRLRPIASGLVWHSTPERLRTRPHSGSAERRPSHRAIIRLTRHRRPPRHSLLHRCFGLPRRQRLYLPRPLRQSPPTSSLRASSA
ncbi:hypothetical protein FJ938_15325 [Mesorhizobium sp. B2-4-14]|uniref:hypothetical protein n=1 Tax=Mesorhizobium sp. B2-4-14 TaxID=2589935 RepID=UPI0011267C13|nr:hypothetical protein [Mesorhizobium sp. B2-4-14]TPL05324.1 hypothetical protein FJ938_15325 [Mesorhizobium sp. B2-4-14]